MEFPALFNKGIIGGIKLRNRIVMLPMSTNFPNESGGVTKELIDYYEERAKGGVGLIIVEGACVDFPMGQNGATKLRCDQGRFVTGLSRLVDAIHKYGSFAILQIQHAGPSASLGNIFNFIPLSSSTILDSEGKVLAKEASKNEISRIISDFKKVAKYAKEAGFAGVEIHGAHSYLIARFLSPLCNKRNDEYGGNFENRARFLLEIIKGIREEVGRDFIISIRINGDEFVEGGIDINQSKKISILLEKATVDLLNVSSGLRDHSDGLSMYKPQGWRVSLAREIKQVVNIPVIASGGIKEPYFAENVLQNNEVDFIGLGRALIADPFWTQKAFSGKAERIKKCISCNIGCAERRIYGKRSITCSINPDVGREGHIDTLSIRKECSKKVLIIGAGPAGLNAAIEAKKNGHRVKVFEKDNKTGGLLNQAAIPNGKTLFGDYINYLQLILKENEIKISFNKSISLKEINEMKPDVIIIATGSKPIIPKSIPGIENLNVLTAIKLLKEGKKIVDKRIIVLGGGSIGCEIADFLANKNSVTIVEMNSKLAAETERINRNALISRLEKAKVSIMINARLESIDQNKIKINQQGAIKELYADYVILAIGATPVLPDWIEKAKDDGIECFVIGDASFPRKMINAVHEGIMTGRNL